MRIASILLPLALLAATPSDARGSYCSRNPTACRERREAEAAAIRARQAWYAALSPLQKAQEDLRVSQIDLEAVTRDRDQSQQRAEAAEADSSSAHGWLFGLGFGLAFMVVMFIAMAAYAESLSARLRKAGPRGREVW